jgi:ketosteroid isomerase-like protein
MVNAGEIMSMTADAQVALIARLFDAFNAHDADGVGACMTDDVVFDAAVGAEVYGTRTTGRTAVAAGFAKTFKDLPDVRWDDVTSYPGAGDYVTTTWVMRATRPDGLRLEVEGIDLFTLKDGLVSNKRAFRKERPLQK